MVKMEQAELAKNFWNKVFTEPKASELAKLRIEARNKHRIPYDCLHAIVDGDRVRCNKGNHIGSAKDSSTDLVSTLRGRSALVCQNCTNYDADKVTARIIEGRVYD